MDFCTHQPVESRRLALNHLAAAMSHCVQGCMQVACSSIKAGRVFYESEAGLPAANLKAPFTEFR